MRYHYGLGVGHIYSHEANILEDPCLAQVTPRLNTRMTVKIVRSLGKRMLPQPPDDNDDADDDDDNDDEEDEDEDYVGVEDPDFFDQALNASTESLIEALDDMFTTCHTFDYKD